MAIKIGHSAKDENGKITDGAAGDQNGREVCIREWYNGGWGMVLRPKTSELAERSAMACEAACANPNVGYDQNQRNTLNAQARAVGYDLSRIAVGCECDCSAFMHVCAIAGGANLSYGSNGYTTRTMAAAFIKSGDYEKLTDSKYLTSDKYLRRGDILLKEGVHTVMVLENGAEAGAAPAANNNMASGSGQLPVIQKGSKEQAVRSLQVLLKARGYQLGSYGPKKDGVDGEFGKATEDALKKFQASVSLDPNGKCDAASWVALITM